MPLEKKVKVGGQVDPESGLLWDEPEAVRFCPSGDAFGALLNGFFKGCQDGLE